MTEWTTQTLQARILELAKDELPAAGEDFGPRSNLIEAGLDSLAVTQLMLAIEETTGVWVDESLLTETNLANVEALAALVHEQLQRP